MTTPEEILKTSRVEAVVGLSPNPKRPSHRVASYLKDQGYHVIPVNLGFEEILGEKSYPTLSAIPVPVDTVDIFRGSEQVPLIVEEAIRIGSKAVWFQEGIVNEAAAARARQEGLLVGMNHCMMKEHRKLFPGLE